MSATRFASHPDDPSAPLADRLLLALGIWPHHAEQAGDDAVVEAAAMLRGDAHKYPMAAEDYGSVRNQVDDLREAVNALTRLARTQWHRHGPVPSSREPLDRFVDELPEDEAVAVNAALGQSYGSRPGLGWDEGHPIAAAIYLADPANEGEPYPGTTTDGQEGA